MSAKAAVQIAYKQGLKVHGLYVVGSRTIVEGDQNDESELGRDSNSMNTGDLLFRFKSRGNEVLDWMEELCSIWDADVTTDILYGDIPEMILEEARQTGFLALGRRGHIHHNNEFALGENFLSIVTHLPVPMLIGGEQMTNFRRLWILFTAERESSKQIKWAKSFQDTFSSDILVSTYKENEMITDIASTALENLKKDNPVGYIQMLRPIRKVNDIAPIVQDQKVDLIIVERYLQNSLDSFIDRNPLYDMLTSSEVMVFAV